VRFTRALSVVALLGVMVSRPRAAFAQDPAALHKADALFNAGRALLDAGEYAEACPKFAESNSLAPGLGVTLYLADCYERLGKTNSALLWFRHAVELAHARGDKREPVAAGRADALVAKVPKLVVSVSPEAVAQGVHVVLDGMALPPSAWGAPAPVDPGDHVLDVTADARVARHVKFRLAPTPDVHTEAVGPLDAPLPATPVSVAVAPPPPIAPATPAPPPRAPRDRTYLVIAGASAGVGVVGIGVGAALGIVASSKFSDSNSGPCDATNHCTASGLALRSSAEHAGNASTGAFVVGGAALAAGVVVFLVRPRSVGGPTAFVSPGLSRDGAGVNVGGAF
jgi:hypothetical protein